MLFKQSILIGGCLLALHADISPLSPPVAAVAEPNTMALATLQQLHSLLAEDEVLWVMGEHLPTHCGVGLLEGSHSP
jgi:hypothetical protein